MAGQVNDGSGPAAQLSPELVSLESESPASGMPLGSSPPGPVGEALPESGLLADAQPATLLAPIGQLVADTPAIERSLVHARETRGQEDAAIVQPQVVVQARLTAQEGGQEAVAVTDRLQTSSKPAPQTGSVDPRSATHGIDGESGQAHRMGQAPSNAQAQERVSVRYAPAPGRENRVAADRPIKEAGEQQANSRTAVSVPVVLADRLGAAPVMIQDNELVSIKLADLVSLFEDRLDRPLYVWMKESKSASKYVTVETLAAAGIGAKYDPRSRQVVFSVTDE